MAKKAKLPPYHSKWTDKQLKELERIIGHVYQEAYNDVRKHTDAYFKTLIPRLKKEYESGAYTPKEWAEYLKAQLGRGERWKRLQETCADRMVNANVIAANYINDTTPKIYSMNANYEAYTIEKLSPNVSFTMTDENTVRELMKSSFVGIDEVKDAKWNRQLFHNALIKSILVGDDIETFANRLAKDVGISNRTSAVRNARTAVTQAQNRGRLATYEAAHEMGIAVVKRWVCTLDERTRETHRMLDGTRMPYDEPFESVNGNKLMYPGDPSAPGEEIYNCRCTMVTDDVALLSKNHTNKRWTGERTEDGNPVYVENMTYKEWQTWKQQQASSSKQITSKNS